MKLPRDLFFSKTLVALSLLSLAYVLVAHALDRGPSELPTVTPYSLADNLDRDGILRSVHFEEQAQLRRRTGHCLYFDFDSPDAGAALTLEPGSGVEVVERPSLGCGRALQISRASTGSIFLSPPLGPGRSWVLRARARFNATDGRPGERSDLRVRMGLEQMTSNEPPCLSFTRDLTEPSPERLRTLVDQEWQDLEIVLQAPIHAGPTDRARIEVEWRLSTPGLLFLDDVELAASTRLHALFSPDVEPAPDPSEATFAVKRMVTIDHERRLSLLLAPPSTLTYEVTVPEQAVLCLGVAALGEADCGGASELTVALARSGEFEEPLLRTRLRSIDARSFTEHSIDLSRFADSRVRLQFRVAHLPGEYGPVVVLGSPVILSPWSRGLFARPRRVLLATFHDRGTVPRDRGTGPPYLDTRFAGMTFSSVILPTEQPELNLLCTLRGARPQAKSAAVGLRAIENRPSLAEVLEARGYRTLALLNADSSEDRGHGFSQQVLLGDGRELERLAGFLNTAPRSSAFLVVQLPVVATDDFLDSVLDTMAPEGADLDVWVLVVPESTSDSAHQSRASAFSSTWTGPVRSVEPSVDLSGFASLILKWLGEPPEPGFEESRSAGDERSGEHDR